MLYCTNDRFQYTGEISHFIKALRLRQLRVKLISRVVKEFSDSLFPGERRLISLQYSGTLSISLAFIACRPTCFERRLVMRNLHETPTQRARSLYPDSKNNSRRITYGIWCVWGIPSLSPLSSLGITYNEILETRFKASSFF